jgi:hypothetical protein
MAAGDPPTPDAGRGEQRDEPERQIVVNDPEDFAKTRQLRTIFDALDDYRDAVREADERFDNGEIALGLRNKIIFEYMQDVGMAVEPIALSHESGAKLWKEKTYSFNGTVVHKLGAAGTEDAREPMKELVQKHVTGHPTKAELQKVIDIIGFDLRDKDLRKIEDHFAAKAEEKATVSTQEVQRLLNADTKKLSRISMTRVESELETVASRGPAPSPEPEDVVDTIYEAIENAGRGKRRTAKFELRRFATDWGWETTGIKSLLDGLPSLMYADSSDKEFRRTAPPKEISDEVVRDIRIFIQEAGLGIDFNEEQQTKIDDELLEEVDEWRETNT